MQQFGGKDSKRHFTVVMGDKEHGLYVSSTPSSAAKKAVTKLCTANKSKKVEFQIREITQGSKKKTYGPYEGHIEKLKEPIELKGRVIKYKPVAKLIGKISAKKGGMYRVSGGAPKTPPEICYFGGKESDFIFLRENPTQDSIHANPFRGLDQSESVINTDTPTYLSPGEKLVIEETTIDPKSRLTFVKVIQDAYSHESGWIEKKYCRSTPLLPAEQNTRFRGNSASNESRRPGPPFRQAKGYSGSEFRGQPVVPSSPAKQSYNERRQPPSSRPESSHLAEQSRDIGFGFSGQSTFNLPRRTAPSLQAKEDTGFRSSGQSAPHNERRQPAPPLRQAKEDTGFGFSGQSTFNLPRRLEPSLTTKVNTRFGQSASNRQRQPAPSQRAEDTGFRFSGQSASNRPRQQPAPSQRAEDTGFRFSGQSASNRPRQQPAPSQRREDNRFGF